MGDSCELLKLRGQCNPEMTDDRFAHEHIANRRYVIVFTESQCESGHLAGISTLSARLSERSTMSYLRRK
jgi:hypothetical protein